jgi:hypothetical protein
MLLNGDWNRYEWIGGACAATVAATIAELARAAAGVRLRVPLALLRRSGLVLPMVFVDFAILTWALVRRREGRYLVRDLAEPADEAERAWTVLLAGFSPNAYVVDIDADRRQVLLHDLVPNRRSEEPA